MAKHVAVVVAVAVADKREEKDEDQIELEIQTQFGHWVGAQEGESAELFQGLESRWVAEERVGRKGVASRGQKDCESKRSRP